MWEPEADWHPIIGGTGASTAGVWRTARNGVPLVIKRLAAPEAGDPRELSDPSHFAYWRREADVAIFGLTRDTPGLRSSVVAVDEDGTGITLTAEWVEDAANTGLFAAIALGRFAGAQLPAKPWIAAGMMRQRLARTEHLGGWPLLQRTVISDIAVALWERRAHFLDALDLLPQVPCHGDPTIANLTGRDGDDVLALDWGSLGRGAVGADLGLYALSSRESLEPLVDAYLVGLPAGLAQAPQVLFSARIHAVYTALSRAEWALQRVSTGEGALAGKFNHPAVRPHLLALQRQSDHIDALLGI